MPKGVIAKGNIHRSDYLRALVSDTQPGDVPIVVSNDGFYKNAKEMAAAPTAVDPVIAKLLDPHKPFTVPYRYNIMRPDKGFRRLSLAHPQAQLAVVDFYKVYGNLICHYCQKSTVSLRSPRKSGSTYFIRGPQSDLNKFKGSGLETVDLENTTSNPATYFAYAGVSRAFRFFQSSEYLRLEKRYSVMYFTDISKCFNSIYTHTLYWAVADIDTAKNNTSAISFSNSFDRLMQSMNYNETNGICVGAEISRLFAEVILSETDKRVLEAMSRLKKKYRTDFELRRYVDDYYVFAVDSVTANQVLTCIELALAEFNLHLSKEKTHEVPRPFMTVKSRLISDANVSLERFFEKFVASDFGEHGRYSYPMRVRRPGALLRSFLDSVKSSCFDHKAGYQTTSNYVIGALASRLSALVEGYTERSKHDEFNVDHYVDAVLLILEAVYFFYNVNPTVPSSLRVAQAAIEAARFFDAHVPDRSQFLAEQIVRWTLQFIRSISASTSHSESNCVPLEALNILLVLGEVGRTETLARQAITEFCGQIDTLNYFEIVSFLYCMGDGAEFSQQRTTLYERSLEIIFSQHGVRVESESAHLALDLLACPFLTVEQRAGLYNQLRKHLELPQVSKAKAEEAITGFVPKPWFVDWSETNLLRLIQKKELSAVY